MEKQTCSCSSYPFPHRAGGGKCARQGELYLCNNCDQPCDAVEVDFGIGPYEYWGSRGNDVRKEVVSSCCNATYRNLNEKNPKCKTFIRFR